MNCIFYKGISMGSSLRCGSFGKICFNGNFSFPTAMSCYPKAFFHSSVCYQCNKQQPVGTSVAAAEQPVHLGASKAPRKSFKPVDWLPFEWIRRSPRSPFDYSGDLVKELEYDPSWPKPNFELSDELKTASEDIKHMFSLATASKAEIKEVVKRRMLQKIQRHPNDLTSPEVNIALKTLTIRSLFEHSRTVKDMKGGRIFLGIQIKKRNRLLKNLRIMDMDRFNWLCKELKSEYKPEQLGGIRERYCKKWDLRRLTKEYCAKMIKDKKIAYHEELKQQQADFLKEKEEILAWIEKEEKELANLTI